MLNGWMEWMDSGYPLHCFEYLSTCGAKRPSFSWLPYLIDACPYDYKSYVMQLFSYMSQKYSNDKERDREWSGWHQVTEGGHWAVLATPPLTQLCTKHQQRNMKKTSEKYLKMSTDNLTHQRYIWNCQQTILPSFVQNINRETWKIEKYLKL